MVILKQFWTPCFWYENVRSAVGSIAFYTAVFSVISIAYTCYVLDGGESSQYYMPYFETDRATNMHTIGALVIVFMLLLILSSLALVRGVSIDHRGLILPWLSLMSCIIFYQIWLGFWWLYAYYIYLSTVLVVLIDWLWLSYNIYTWLAVYSMYQEIRIKQTPNLEFMYA